MLIKWVNEEKKEQKCILINFFTSGCKLLITFTAHTHAQLVVG